MGTNTISPEVYLKEISHHFNPTFFNSQSGIYGLFLKSLFDIKVSGLDKIKELQEQENAVFKYALPHKSHLDYVIPQYVLASENMRIPKSLAGSNLFFFPFGPYLKRMGAIKVPRKGTREMIEISLDYVKQQLLEKNDILNFPEQGRSKEGHLRKYKSGYFQSAIEAQIENPNLKVYVVPVPLVYDRVPEDGTFRRSTNLAKKHPKAKDAFDFLSVLFSPIAQVGERKSSVYIDFGETIPVNGFIAGNPDIPPRELGKKLASFTRNRTLENYKLVGTPLLAKSIEGSDTYSNKGYLEKHEVMENSQKLLEFLEYINVNVEIISEHGLENSIEIAIEYFAKRKSHKVIKEKNNELVVLRPEIISFYANTIDHFFE